MNIEKAIGQIQERNKRVELDKAWEISFTRRGFIAAATYVIAGIWLWIINESAPWWKALVPTGGYVLSTLSLPFVKEWWSKKQ